MQRILTWLALVLGGCQLAPAPHTKDLLEREQVETSVNSHQLRVLVNEFVLYFRDRIELTADRILSETDDVGLRKNALLWKINAISAAFQAASRQDPLGAHLDVWILNRQMTALIASEQGATLFGDWQSMALLECEQLENRIRQNHEQIGTQLRFDEAFVSKFATDFPLSSLYFDREPMASRYIQEVQTPGKELLNVVANLDENIDELRKLAILYAEHLPKQVRWEAELLALDAEHWPVIQQPLEELAHITAVADSLAQVAEQLPSMVQTERVALLAALENERKAAFAEIETMRRATLQDLRSEREEVQRGIAQERQEIGKLVDWQRQALAGDLQSQLGYALGEVDTISQRRLREAIEAGPQLVDHSFRRLAQLLVALVAAGVILIPLIVFVLRTRHRPTQLPSEERTSPVSLSARVPAEPMQPSKAA